MILKNIYFLYVPWTKVASALEGLIQVGSDIEKLQADHASIDGKLAEPCLNLDEQ